MQIIETQLKDIPKSRVGDAAKEDDVGLYIDTPTIVTVGGSPVLAYGDLTNFDGRAVVSWCQEAPFGKVRRMAYQKGKEWSTKTTSELYFGYTMGRQVYNVPPGPTRTTREHAKIYQTQIIPLYRALAKVFHETMPAQYAKQCGEIGAVNDEWRIDKGLYTQVVVNNANVFSYHVDAMNFPNSWNAMAVFSSGMVGGNTIVPALNMRFSMRGAKFLIFNAQEVIHAVTPLTKVKADAYRYSLVYYAHRDMARMKSHAEEMAKFKVSLDRRFDKDYQAKRTSVIQKNRQKMRQSGFD